MGLETEISESGTAIFGPTGRTGQRGLPLEVDHFDREISTWTKPFHLHLDRNSRKFWHNGKHPLFRKAIYSHFLTRYNDVDHFSLSET